MVVGRLMTSLAIFAQPKDSLNEAAGLMWRNDCGVLPICGGAREVIGVLTDRDICMYAHFHKQPLSALRVEDAMTRGVKTCKATDTIADVEQTMSEAGVRRLPVVDAADRLVGIIALADIATEAARESHLEKQQVAAAEVATVLAAICMSPTSDRKVLASDH